MHQGNILHDSLWINTLSKEYVNSLVKHFMHMQRKLSSPLHVSCVFRFSIYSTHSFNFSVINLSKSVFNNIGTLLISLLPMANIITVLAAPSLFLSSCNSSGIEWKIRAIFDFSPTFKITNRQKYTLMSSVLTFCNKLQCHIENKINHWNRLNPSWSCKYLFHIRRSVLFCSLVPFMNRRIISFGYWFEVRAFINSSLFNE